MLNRSECVRSAFARLGSVSEDEFATATLADIYARQGHYEKAVAIYERLLQKAPDDHELAARLRALIAEAATHAPSAPDHRQRRLEDLERLLTQVRRRRRRS